MFYEYLIPAIRRDSEVYQFLDLYSMWKSPLLLLNIVKELNVVIILNINGVSDK